MAPSSNKSGSLVFGAALALRLALFEFPTLANMLGNQVEISTPVTSFKRCNVSCFQRKKKQLCPERLTESVHFVCFCNLVSEGVFLFKNGVPPYDGGVFHQVRHIRSLLEDRRRKKKRFTRKSNTSPLLAGATATWTLLPNHIESSPRQVTLHTLRSGNRVYAAPDHSPERQGLKGKQDSGIRQQTRGARGDWTDCGDLVPLQPIHHCQLHRQEHYPLFQHGSCCWYLDGHER